MAWQKFSLCSQPFNVIFSFRNRMHRDQIVLHCFLGFHHCFLGKQGEGNDTSSTTHAKRGQDNKSPVNKCSPCGIHLLPGEKVQKCQRNVNNVSICRRTFKRISSVNLFSFHNPRHVIWNESITTVNLRPVMNHTSSSLRNTMTK